jgi:chromosome segregation ATPase
MKPLNQFEQSQLDTVTQEIERYTNLNDAEKNEIYTMKERISNLKEEIWRHRRKMGGSNAAIEHHQNIERQSKTLESKVDQATLKLNRTLAANRSLREEIDSLREERISFEGVYRKVEKVSYPSELVECWSGLNTKCNNYF